MARLPGADRTYFTYSRIVHGLVLLVDRVDDYSRFVMAWNLTSTMGSGHVTAMVVRALAVTGADQVCVRYRPRLLSDNGPARLPRVPRDYLWVHGAPYDPPMQSRTATYHRR